MRKDLGNKANPVFEVWDRGNWRMKNRVWYGIQTEPGQEEIIKQRIKELRAGISSDEWRIFYCIKKKRYLGQWHEKRERFLPGYMFLITNGLESIWNMDRTKAKGKAVINLSEENAVFVPVKDEEIRFLMRLTKGNDEIGMSYGVIQNGVLKISDGVLRGMESRVRKIDRHKRKAYIAMKIGRKEELAEIGLEIMEKT